MMKNPYSLGGTMFGSSSEKKGKATLGTRNKTILYDRAKHRCENCGKRISFADMQSGHKNKARSKGGKATLSNSVCLCYTCNKNQGTDSWSTFRRKQGKSLKRTATSSKRKNKPRKRKPRRSTNLLGSPTFRPRLPKFSGF